MIKIGTRGSQLALWQANELKDKLANQSIESELVIIKTKGDKIQNLGFDKLEGKGFFTKEIEEALLNKTVDVAVHSLKDLPTTMPEGLSLCGLNERANPSDILIYHPDVTDLSRPLNIQAGSQIGTSSIRRKVQLADLDEMLNIVDVRGNVPTRVQKVRDKIVDGIVIASAGVDRLDINLDGLKYFRFDPSEFVPAPAQGVVAYQCRTDNDTVSSIIHNIHNYETATGTNVERSILKLMDGGCQTPIGAYVKKDEQGNFHAYAMFGTKIGAPIKRVLVSQTTHIGIAEKVVNQLKAI